MKRDVDLVRKILFQIEEKGQSSGWVDLDIPGYRPDQVAHHVWLLRDAGLIEAQELSSTEGFDMRPKRLTWAGHEFLDDARNDAVWGRVRQLVREKGGAVPFEVLKGLLLKATASAFAIG